MLAAVQVVQLVVNLLVTVVKVVAVQVLLELAQGGYQDLMVVKILEVVVVVVAVVMHILLEQVALVLLYYDMQIHMHHQFP
jgi:hypothetical protein